MSEKQPVTITFTEFSEEDSTKTLLVGVTSDGKRESEIFNSLIFPTFNRMRAEKKIINKLKFRRKFML
ncbi:hypothetical protein Goe21_00010 [Bacillus phage vB_BsuM-Goe21]|nr:hypothetical protein Goe21_00010 [Bacillus phage vB_BsuM-Goe21]